MRRRGRRALARGPGEPREGGRTGGRRGRFPGLQRLAGLQAATHPSRPRGSPGASSPRLDLAPPRAFPAVFPGRAFWELGPPARARSARRGVYLLPSKPHTHVRSIARSAPPLGHACLPLPACAPATPAPSHPELSFPLSRIPVRALWKPGCERMSHTEGRVYPVCAFGYDTSIPPEKRARGIFFFLKSKPRLS